MKVKRDKDGDIDWEKLASFVMGLALIIATVWFLLLCLILFTQKVF